MKKREMTSQPENKRKNNQPVSFFSRSLLAPYLIWYRRKNHDMIYRAYSWTDLEDKLCELILQGNTVTAIMEGGKITVRTGKEAIACPFCGGVDAHLYNCRGGYGV